MEVRPATPPAAPSAAVPVFCKDCKHFDPSPKYRPVCMAPQARTIHLVHGYQNPECDLARSERRGGACGIAGELFVQASPDGIPCIADSTRNLVESGSNTLTERSRQVVA